MDVRNFDKDEIRVKARQEFVIIEGKSERKTKTGYVVRKFTRKIKLPQGCDPNFVNSDLSYEGILTITAKKQFCEENYPCENVIPIKYSGPKEDATDDPCKDYVPITNDKDNKGGTNMK